MKLNFYEKQCLLKLLRKEKRSYLIIKIYKNIKKIKYIEGTEEKLIYLLIKKFLND